MKGENEQFYKLQKLAKKETNTRKKKLILKDMSILKAQVAKLLAKKEEEKIFRKQKKEMIEQKIKDRQKPIEIHNHINQPHYEHNFEGTFGNIFEKIFGT